MMPLRTLTISLTTSAALATLLLSGCHVTSNKNGKNDNVDISTPFGGMHVKTNDGTDTAAIGLTPYPGATPWKDDKDGNNADINMSFGDFHLGVKAASFRSTDSQDKVLAFYRKDLARYGEVITCKGKKTIGQPTRTSQGLTCDDKHSTVNTTQDSDGIHINDGSDSNLELRAGSQAHQHIVGVDTKDGATKIGLVALDLPTNLGKHNDSDSE